MKQIVYDNAPLMLEWAAEKISHGLKFRPDAKAIGLVSNGVLRAVVVYDCFSEVDCNMHIASDGSKKWLNKEFMVTAFAHPFIQWKLNRVTGLVPEDNAAAIKFDVKLGFKYEGRCREALPSGKDVFILGMLKSECKLIGDC